MIPDPLARRGLPQGPVGRSYSMLLHRGALPAGTSTDQPSDLSGVISDAVPVRRSAAGYHVLRSPRLVRFGHRPQPIA